MHSKPALAAIAAALCIFGVSVSSSAAPSGDACSLLTQAQVNAALGASMAAGESGGLSGLCMWSEPGGQKKVFLTVQTLDQFNIGKTPIPPRITKTPVSGIGDEAYYGTISSTITTIPGLTTLSVRRGKTAFVIDVRGPFPTDQVKAIEKTLAQDVLAKL